MCEFKYIVMQIKSDSGTGPMLQEIPIIFPKCLVHLDMKESVHFQLLRHDDLNANEVKCVAAGFLNILTLQCYGKSETLKISSRGDADSNLIKLYSYTQGLL